MKASKDKGRIDPAAAASHSGGGDPVVAPGPRTSKAARIIGAFAAGTQPERAPETDSPGIASKADRLNKDVANQAPKFASPQRPVPGDVPEDVPGGVPGGVSGGVSGGGAPASFRSLDDPAPAATPEAAARNGGDSPAIKAEEVIEEPQEWRVAPSAIDFEDPLLSCLVTLASLLERPISAEALKAGLPRAAERFTPELAVRAAERAGIEARITSRPKIRDILPVTLPCILLLRGGGACVLLGYQGSDTAEITIPEGGTGKKTIGLDELQSQYTGYAIFARPEFKFDQRASDIRLAQPRAWFWGTLVKFWPIYSHVLLASALINCFALASPLFIMNVYDRVVPNNAVETLWVLVASAWPRCSPSSSVMRNLRTYFVDVAGKNADVLIASSLLEQRTWPCAWPASPASRPARIANQSARIRIAARVFHLGNRWLRSSTCPSSSCSSRSSGWSPARSPSFRCSWCPWSF